MRLLLGVALALASTGAARAGDLTVGSRLWGAGEVRWTVGGRTTVLQRFDAPVEMIATEVSPDARFAFAWYRPDGRARRVAIYDLRAGTITADFAPGFGGDLHFTPAGTLVHRWGCGTNCSEVRVYDWEGGD